MHNPEQHCSAPPQVRPHAPQWATLLLTSTQLPAQHWVAPEQLGPAPHRHTPAAQVSPVAHGGSHGTSVVHVPSRQASPAPQTFPQAPQFEVSAVVGMQLPPQQDSPSPHSGPAPHMQVLVVVSQVSPGSHAGSHGGMTQSPPSHTSPSAQTRPQAPQFAASRLTSTQPSVQQISGALHWGPSAQRHCPDWHSVPRESQVRPQAPQLSGSLGNDTHAPAQQLSPVGQGVSGPHPTA